MIIQLLLLLGVHWVGDFVLQTHWQAQNKSKNNRALLAHICNYTLALWVATPFIFGWRDLATLLFVPVNACLHFGTDYFTSRWTARLFGKEWHNFFVMMGLDQYIHQVTLGATMLVFFKP